MEYELIYDASTAAFPWGPVLHFGIMLVAGVVGLVLAIVQKHRFGIFFMLIWLAGVVRIGGPGASNVVSQHLKCKEWAKSQNYDFVEGLVEDFHPMPESGHDDERFTVNGAKFEFSDFDVSKGGFNNTASHGGPIREGLPVRIAYRDGRILKLEIGSN